MIGSILGIASGFLPVNPVGIVRGLAGVLSGGGTRRSKPQPSVTAQFSPLAQQVNRAGQPGRAAGLDLGTLQAQYEANLASFQHQLGKLFSDSGIDTSQPVTLKLNSSGNLVVQGDHPQKGQIQNLLDQQPQLVHEFQQLASASRFLNAQEASSGMAGLPSALSAYQHQAAQAPYTVTLS